MYMPHDDPTSTSVRVRDRFRSARLDPGRASTPASTAPLAESHIAGISAIYCPAPTMNLAEDIMLFSESEIAEREIKLPPAEIQKILSTATGALVQTGQSPRLLWQIDELVEVSNFAAIVLVLDNYVHLKVLLQILLVLARHWVTVDHATFAVLLKISSSYL